MISAPLVSDGPEPELESVPPGEPEQIGASWRCT